MIVNIKDINMIIRERKKMMKFQKLINLIQKLRLIFIRLKNLWKCKLFLRKWKCRINKKKKQRANQESNLKKVYKATATKNIEKGNFKKIQNQYKKDNKQ